MRKLNAYTYVACAIKSILSNFPVDHLMVCLSSTRQVNPLIDDPNNGNCNFFGHVGCYDCMVTYNVHVLLQIIIQIITVSIS